MPAIEADTGQVPAVAPPAPRQPPFPAGRGGPGGQPTSQPAAAVPVTRTAGPRPRHAELFSRPSGGGAVGPGAAPAPSLRAARVTAARRGMAGVSTGGERGRAERMPGAAGAESFLTGTRLRPEGSAGVLRPCPGSPPERRWASPILSLSLTWMIKTNSLFEEGLLAPQLRGLECRYREDFL